MAKSSQDKLNRLRRPPLPGFGKHDLGYDMPFIVGVVGDFSGDRSGSQSSFTKRSFTTVDFDSFNAVMGSLEAGITLQVPDRISGLSDDPLVIHLTFSSLDDFRPDIVLGQVNTSSRLLGIREKLNLCDGNVPANSGLQRWIDELAETTGNQIFDSMPSSPGGVRGEFASQAEFREYRAALIESIDRLLSQQAQEIIGHERFRQLEASWRGLNYLTGQCAGRDLAIVRLLDLSKEELCADFEQCEEYRSSILWKLVYSDVYGRAGAVPFSCLLGDFEFNLRSPRDIALLQGIARVSAGSFTPFVSGVPGKDSDDFGDHEQADEAELENSIVGDKSGYWSLFRDCDESRFVTLTAPRVLGRSVEVKCSADGSEPRASAYPRGKDSPFLWMNAAWVLATNLAVSWSETRWCHLLYGSEMRGFVENLPLVTVANQKSGPLNTGTIRSCMSEYDCRSTGESGIALLVKCPNRRILYFDQIPTSQRPKVFDSPEATAHSAICARLPAVLAIATIARWLMLMARDRIGTFSNAEDIEIWLERAIMAYVSADPKPSEAAKARYPLREAKVQLRAVSGSERAYDAILFIRPWLQTEELNRSVRIQVRLPAQVGDPLPMEDC